jgi:hypothetical protein
MGTKWRGWLKLRLYLEKYHKDSYKLLNHIKQVIGDGTQVSFANVKTKGKSKQCIHTHFQKKLKKIKINIVCQIGFSDRKGALMEVMQQGAITSQVYCETPKTA